MLKDLNIEKLMIKINELKLETTLSIEPTLPVGLYNIIEEFDSTYVEIVATSLTPSNIITYLSGYLKGLESISNLPN